MMEAFVVSGTVRQFGGSRSYGLGSTVRERGGAMVCRTFGRRRRRMVVRCSVPSGEDGDRIKLGSNLVLAAMSANLAGVEDMIAKGVDVDYASDEGGKGMTALMWAAAEGNLEIAKALLAAKADVNLTNEAGYSAILHVFEALPSAKVATPPPAGYPGMPGKEQPEQMKMVKKETGHVGIAKFLLVSNADRFAKSPRTGDTLLHMAARRGHIGLVDLLISLGIPVNSTNKGYLHTPLHDATINNHPDVVKLLLDNGADINAENRVGWTPLLWAAAQGNSAMVELLCKAGADVNLKGEGQDRPGERTTSPLQEASKSRNPAETRRILMRFGAK